MKGTPPAAPGKDASVAAVLFDFGGTLDADGVSWKERFFRLYRDEGMVSAPGQFDPIFYAVDDALVGRVSSTLSFRDTVSRLVRGVSAALEVRDQASVGRIAGRFLESALERLRHNARLLRRLSGRYRLGVVSNFYGNLATVCEDAGIRRFFATVVDSACSGCAKPDPRIFWRAMDELGVDASSAVFVGDSLPRDMAGARSAGMAHIWLTPTERPGERPCCPGDRVVRALDELEELLL